MVSKAQSRMGSSRSIDYILSDKELGRAKELDRNGIVGSNGKEILNEFKFIQQTNMRCVNNVISLIISPSPEDGRKLTQNQLKEILQKQLKHLKLENHQFISTVHYSTGKPHIHAIINRIDTNKGKALDDSWISKKAQSGAEMIAREMNLRTASQVQKEEKAKKIAIKAKVYNTIRSHKARNWDQYVSALNQVGLTVQVISSKVTNKINGYTIDGIKASDIHRSLTMSKIENTLSSLFPERVKQQSRGYHR